MLLNLVRSLSLLNLGPDVRQRGVAIYNYIAWGTRLKSSMHDLGYGVLHEPWAGVGVGDSPMLS